jgi:hypothetical protein
VKRVALVVMICGLAAAGTFAGYKIHGKLAFEASANSEIFADLPTKAPVVIFVDAKVFRESALYKKLMKDNTSPTPSGDYAEFIKETGFDFSRDLDRVAMAVESAEHGSKTTAIAEGRFDQERIAAYAKIKGKISVRDGKTYFEFDEPKSNRTMEMSFLSANRVRVTSVEISPKKSDDDKAAANPITPEDSAERIARVAGSPLFAIADVRSWSGQVNLGNYSDLIRSIKRYTLTASPDGDTLHIALEAECATPEDAQQLGSTMSAAKLLAPSFLNNIAKKNGAASMDTVNQFMNSIQITEDGPRVKLAFAITGDMLTQAGHMGAAKPAVQPDK